MVPTPWMMMGVGAALASAVDYPNGSFGGLGGIWSNQWLGLGGGRFTVPVDSAWGTQVDGWRSPLPNIGKPIGMIGGQQARVLDELRRPRPASGPRPGGYRPSTTDTLGRSRGIVFPS
jgi:hypothetical protein